MKTRSQLPVAIPSLILFIAILTVLTQVGGVLVLVGGILGLIFLRNRFSTTKKAFWAGAAAMYLVGLITIPQLAKPFGRECLPWFATREAPIRPRNPLYPLLFRNYVKPELAKILKQSSKKFSDSHGGRVKVDYLDACFPFAFPFKKGMPMLPHLSHKDGKKVDLCFVYKNERSGKLTRSPSAIGYWIYEHPKRGQKAYPANMLRWDMPWIQGINRHRKFDPKATRDLIRIFARNPKIQKMFLEPHLQSRMGLGRGQKVHFQSVRAARHDDHIHLQIY